MNRQEFLDKWALIVPSDKKNEFEADFLYVLLGKPYKKQENTVSNLHTAHKDYNDDLAHIS